MYQRIDLKEYLIANGTKVKGITVYGMIKGAIIPPPPIDTIFIKADRTATTIIDIVAIQHNNNYYWTHGEILVNIHPTLLEQAQDTPTRRLAVQVSGGRLEVSHHGIIAMYKWGMDDGRFVCFNSRADKINPKEHPEIVNMLLGGIPNNWQYPLPEDGNKYNPASSGFRFTYTEQWQFLQSLAIDPKAIEKAKNLHDTSAVLKGDKGNNTGVGREDTTTSTQSQPQPQTQTNNNVQGSTYGANPAYNPLLDKNAPVSNTDVVPIKKVVSGFTPRLKSHITLTNTSKKKPDYNRPEALPYSELMGEYEEVYNKAMDKLGDLTAGQDAWQSAPYLESTIDQIATGLTKNWDKTYLRKPLKVEFKTVVLSVLEQVLEEGRPPTDYNFPEGYEFPDQNAVESAFNTASELLAGALYNDAKPVSDSSSYRDVYDFIGTFKVTIALSLLAPYLDLRPKALMPLANTTNIDVNAYIHNNIYMLGFEASGLYVDALDKLRLLFGLPITDEMRKIRNAIQVHSTLLNQNEKWVGGSTVHLKSVVERNIRTGFMLDSYQLKSYNDTGCILPASRIEGLNAFFEGSITPEDFSLKGNYKTKKISANRYLIADEYDTPSKILQDAIDTGLVLELESGETGQVFISDTALARKEIYVYNRIYALLQNETIDNFTDEMLEESATEFEALKDKEMDLPAGTFKLEARQKEAAYLIKHSTAILTGGAGSGKTTTAEFLLYCIKKYLGLTEGDIFFAAPTGRASQRLSEVVKAPAYTIHRLFGLSVNVGYSLKPYHWEQPEKSIRCLILDEASIKDINLLYAMMLKFPEDGLLYFLGDDDQLPPIGFGKPLANLLTFLPVVHLNVSKRAAEGSKITVNANKIINPEDTSDLECDDTVEICDEKDPNMLVTKLTSIVKYHLSEDGTYINMFGIRPLDVVGRSMSAEDIQIVTPYSNSGVFSSKVLNRQLQDIYNPLKQGMSQLVTSGYEDGKKVNINFRKGDRVIHAKGNFPSKRRFKQTGNGSFQMLDSTGVYNGDLGILVGFYFSHHMTVEPLDNLANMSDEDTRFIMNIEKAKEIAQTNDNFIPSQMYVAIKYKGVDSNGKEEEFIILYSCKLAIDEGYNKHITPMEFGAVEHSWALTTHKLQGSQAKLVIMICMSNDKRSSEPFVNRNMLYTMKTRAQKALYMLGDIYGADSAFNIGKRFQANSTRYTLFDII